MTEPTRRKRKGCGCGLGCLLAVVVAVVLPALVWLVSSAVTGARAQAEIERLRQAGEPADAAGLRKLLPQIAPGEDNAAMLYQEAFDRKVEVAGYQDIAGVPRERWTTGNWQSARHFVSSNTAYFDSLDRASRVEKCDFPTNWDDLVNAMFPQFARMREVARALNLKAELQLAEGKLDQAAETCATEFRIARHAAQSPTIIAQLVAVAIRGIGAKELQRVLSEGTPSVATCRRLFTEVDDPHRVQAWVNAMRGERVFGLDVCARVEQGRYTPGMFGEDRPSGQAYAMLAYGTAGRPFLNLDKQRLLQFTTRNVEAFSLPWREAKAAVDALEAEEEQLPAYALLAKMLLPVFKRALWSRDKDAAYLGAARIALAAKAYRGEHGKYPAALTDLEKDGWKLPPDPFTGKAYLYRREGPGFAVWSTGPDLKDNNARDADWSHDKIDQPGYDFVFRCAR